jgi:fumarate hydratase class II
MEKTIPGIEKLRDTLAEKSKAFRKDGKNRSHPFYGCHSINLGQEFSVMSAQLHMD